MNQRPRNPAFESLTTYAFVQLAEAKSAARDRGVEVIDFSIGDPHERTPERIRSRLAASIPERSSYPASAGMPELRESIAGWVGRRFGIPLDPDEAILPTNGSKEAIFSLHQAVIDPAGPRKTVLIPDPAYPVYEVGARFAGADVVRVPLDPANRFLPDLDSLGRDVLDSAALFWVNYPNNPTGAVASRAFYDRLLDLARLHRFWVASDEAYSEIYFEEPPVSALGSGSSNLVLMQTLSKRSAMTGYRSGFMAGDPELIGLLRKVRPSQGVATPEFIQWAAIEAWSDETHVVEQRAVYRRKRAILMPVLERAGLVLGGSEAGLFLYMRVPDGETSTAFATRLLEAGVAIAPGTMFGTTGEGWARMALVPTERECEAAAAVLEKIL